MTNQQPLFHTPSPAAPRVCEWVEVRRSLFEPEARVGPATADLSQEFRKHRSIEEPPACTEGFAQATLDALSAHICILDEDGVIIAVNRAWREFARNNPPLRSNVCEGANYLATCEAAGVDETAGAFARGIQTVLSGGLEQFSLEYPCHSPDEKRWFIGWVTRFAGDGPPRAVVAHENITARRIAEDALRESEARFRHLIEALPAAVYTSDPAGRITLFNKTAVELCGRVPQLGEELWSEGAPIFHPDGTSMPPGESPMAQALAEGRSVRGREMIVERPDGTRAYIVPHADPLRDGAGTLVGAVNVLVDLTDRREAEARLAELNRQLVDLSREAGMAEVATSVLHNVGNVLNSANISIDLAMETVRGSKVASLSRIAAVLGEHAADLPAFFASGGRGAQLPNLLAQLAEHLSSEHASLLKELESLRASAEHINGIVAMQQSYAGTLSVVEEQRVVDLIEAAARMNAASLGRHGVRVIREYAPALPPISVDRHRVLQILVNLIQNAKQAMEGAAGAEKLLTLRSQCSGEDHVQIIVADNGIGIPAENLTSIFAHGFTTREAGHGFGLHSAALAARAMGGSLTAQSEGAGHGATFTLELPLQPPTL